MKRNLIFGFGFFFIAIASCSFTNNSSFDDSDKDKLLIDLISYVLEKGHYEPKNLNDRFSSKVFDRLFENLDPLKRYFLSSDLEEFEPYRFQIDDQIKNTDLSFFNKVYDRYDERQSQAKERYQKVLSKPFDFYAEDEILVDYDKLGFVETEKELANRWRKQLKLNALNTYDSKIETYTSENELERNDLKRSKLKEIESEAREQTRKDLFEYFDFLEDFDKEDTFVEFLNAIVEEYDPHTYYMAPTDKDRFDISMSGKFEGIGARLQKKPEGTKIVEIISGGPVWRSQALEVGDEILKVRQADEELSVNIVGMPIDDAIKLIKGPKGTEVFLTVKRVDGQIDEVAIVRDVVELEESYAKSVIIEDQEEGNYGLINLPKFYIDFEDYDNRNAATDVLREIENLKKEGVEGLILDLRNNGGGSLKTVIDMAGYFISEGPIVQVSSLGKRKEIHEDNDERVQWDGPLVVLVNELSASASEILAAAIQDYKRGIILGSTQTFGKGTVQNLIPLDNIVRSNEFGDLGALKITTQKFYRINGGSTQLRGVTSDIPLPDRYSYIDIGERDHDNPMKWDQISPTNYAVWENEIDFEQVIASSRARISKSKEMQLIDQEAKWIKEQRDNKLVSLNYDQYLKEEAQLKKETDRFEVLDEYDSKLNFSSLKDEERLFSTDSILREKRARWHKELSRDLYVEEAVQVLKDLKKYTFKRPSPIKG